MKLSSHTKRLLSSLLFLLLTSTNLFSQAISAYTFATGTGGSIATLSSPTSLISSGVDDVATAIISFPGNFSFMFGGTTYTQFSVSSNGVLNLGSTACPNTYANTIASVGTNIKVTPFWDDIVTTGDGVRYQLTGTAPNRSFIIIWNGADYTTAAAVQFQLTLVETTNAIRFDYGAGSGGTANIGICNSTTEFESVKVNNNTMSTSSAQNSVSWPGAGRYYTFTPPVVIPTVTSFTPTSGCATVDNVSITGTNFGGVTSVKFGGVNAQSFSIISSTSITAIPAAGTTGKVTVTNSAGTGTSSGNFTINAILTVGATATPSANVCSGSSVTLSGTGASTYSWSDGVNNGVSFTPSATKTYTVTGTSSGGCISTGTVTVNYVQSSTTSNAGPDQSSCSTTATLAANTPSVGTGTWTKVSGTGGTFSNANSPTSTFTGNAGVSYALRWSISNSTCISSDDVVISFLSNQGSVSSNDGVNTINVSVSPTGMVTNPNSSCQWYYNYGVAFNYTITVTGANASSVPVNMQVTFGCTGGNGGTTSYSTITSTGSSSGSRATGYDITVPAVSSNNYGNNPDCSHATFSNLNCSNTATVVLWGGNGAGSFSQTITVSLSPTTSNAGPDQTVCGSTSTTLAANAALSGTGSWSIISGTGGALSSASSATSGFTGTVGSTYTLRWTINNGSCSTSTDDVVITFAANPTAANAGPDQTVCGTSATLAANAPTVGTGTWSIISGTGGVINNTASATSGFTGTAGSTYSLRWAITNSTCNASTDTVIVTFKQNPTVSNAGPDQSICGTSATLAANAPTVGTGTWSIISGTGGTINNASSPTSTFTGVAGNSYSIKWSITNSPCNTSVDTVVINFTSSPTTSNAGPDQTICGTSAALAANTPTIGSGTWSIISGTGGAISNTASPTSSFTGVAGNSYSLKWSTANSPCNASVDNVVINFTANPTASNAGLDQTICGTSATLAANTPTIGIGTWTIISGTSGAISNSLSPTSSFTGVAGNSYSLKWSIANSPCNASMDTVIINFTANPTASNAGPDQTICGTSAKLTANAPTIGTGTWSIISGTGGSFSNSSISNSDFNGNAGTAYTLRWSISNGNCATSTDDVVINLTGNPTTANAGADQTICGTSTILTANTPNAGTGTWSIVSGTAGAIDNASSPTSTFTGIAGNSYALVWTISNSPCLSSTDTVTITLIADPTTANAGVDQSICGTSATLSANAAVIGTGNWSIVNGNGGVLVDPSNPASDFSGSGGATYTLRWNISNSPCNVSTDDVIIKFFDSPNANAGSDQSVCSNSSVTLSGSIGGSANTAMWTTSGNGTFSPGANNLNATYTSGSNDIASGNITLTLTTNNPSGVCVAAISQVNITINGLSNVNAGVDREACVTDTVQLNGQLSGTVVPVLWTTTGDGMFDNDTSLQTVYRPGAADAMSGWATCILSTQPSSNVCSLVSDSVVFKVRASVPTQPSAITGAPTSVCPPLNGINLSTANNPLATTYSWDISAGYNGITFVGTSTSNSQVVDLATTTNSGYSMRVTAYNACGASPYKAVYIRRATSVPSSVTGSLVACAGNTKTYTTNDVTGASAYKWTSTGGILLNGSTTPKIVPDTTIVAKFPTNFSTGTICVSSQVACFTSATKCTTISKSSPALTSLSGAANVCPGSAQVYKVPVTAGAASYVWTLPANITGSSNKDTIAVTIGQNYTAGSICVKATNVCGITTAAKCQQVTSGVPARPASITGPLAGVCGQTVTYTAPANSSTTFMWTVPSGAVINGSNNGNSINVTMPSPFTTAVVSVVAVNSCGSSLARSITVKGAPAQPAAITSNPSSFIANTQGVLFTTDSSSIMPGSNLLWIYPSTCTLVRGQCTTALILNWGSANGTVSLKATNACGNATRTLAVALASHRSANTSANDSTANPISDPIIRTMQTNNQDKGMNLQAYPDMEQKILTFTFYAATSGEYTYSLLDESNREVRDGVIDAQEGVNMQEVEMNSLPTNVVYRLKIKSSETETHINVTMK